MKHTKFNDLISRAEAIDAIQSMTISLGGKEIFHPEAKKSVLNALDDLPSVDAEPVRHGRLVSTGSDELYCEWGDCTVCGFDNRIDAKFCNNCGAKIEGIVPK